ncbi:MAG: DUF1804 family protein [Pseudomonadota bacterium]
MAYDDATRHKVRAAYVHQRLSLEVACVAHGVPLSTGRRWKREAKAGGDDWDNARAAAMLAGDGLRNLVVPLLQSYLTQHQAAIEALEEQRKAGKLEPMAAAKILASLSDSLHKTTAALAKASPEISELAIATDVLERFGNWLADKHPRLAPGFLEVLPGFGEELSRAYG